MTHDPYPLADADRYPADRLVLGAKVYRLQCSVCHTMRGANGLVHLAGSWSPDQLRMNIAKLQHTKPFMPPFGGNAQELEALAQLIAWEVAEQPETWPDTTGDLDAISHWLGEAGTAAGRLQYSGKPSLNVRRSMQAEPGKDQSR